MKTLSSIPPEDLPDVLEIINKHFDGVESDENVDKSWLILCRRRINEVLKQGEEK
jgi:hypothetical protein